MAGLVKEPKAVYNAQDLAVLSGPVKILVTRPSGQIPLGVNSCISQTTSPTSRAASFDDHFVSDAVWGRNIEAVVSRSVAGAA